MAKKKFKKSELTAKERKELRSGNVKVKKNVSSRNIFVGILLFFAIISLGVGIFIPVYLNTGYRNYENPVAVFEIDLGSKTEKLEYEILIKDAPVSSTNFLYLASKGFFDGVIIYDNSSNWVKFGGYTNLSYKHRSDDYTFLETLRGDFSPDKIEVGNALKYQLKPDNNRNLSYSTTNYVLTANTSASQASPTEFQFSCSTSNNAPSIKAYSNTGYYGTQSFSVEPFARPLRVRENLDKVEEVMGAILNAQLSELNENFKTPLVDGKTIKIRSVRVYNYEALWRNASLKYGFESYLTENNYLSSTNFNKEYLRPVNPRN
ncbi:MAG: hypothetical protein J6X29_03685 [Clostridia bacterium]|nr:hypothetical protein [Clostridia bacterium]